MRTSEFWRLMNDEFGDAYARTLASGHHLHALGDRTVTAALDDGVRPKDVWSALCDDLQIPPERRFGRDLPLRERDI